MSSFLEAEWKELVDGVLFSCASLNRGQGTARLRLLRCKGGDEYTFGERKALEVPVLISIDVHYKDPTKKTARGTSLERKHNKTVPLLGAPHA